MKTSIDNLTTDLQNALKAVQPRVHYWVDPINGDDSNDGSENSPLKSLTWLSILLNDKHHVHTYVTVKNGGQIGALSIYNFSGFISFNFVEDAYITDINSNSSANIYCANSSGVVEFISVSIKSAIKNIHNIYVLNSKVLFKDINIESHQESTGILSHNSDILIDKLSVKNCGVPFYAAYSNVSIDPVLVENCGSYVNQCSTINFGPDSVPMTKNIYSSIGSLNDLENGTIIETGSNANGRYYKYANGKLECFENIIIQTSNVGTNFQQTWTYPHSFVVSDNNICDLFINLKSAEINIDAATKERIHYKAGSEFTAAIIKFEVPEVQYYEFSVMAVGRWK